MAYFVFGKISWKLNHEMKNNDDFPIQKSSSFTF